MSGATIAAVGAAVPAGTLSSEALEESLGLPPGWIHTRTGIASRHVASPTDTATSLGTAAARDALDVAGLRGEDVDCVVAATVTPDFRLPATASLIQAALGCDGAAFDLNAGCSGFLCGLAQADALVRSGGATAVLVVGVDLMSRITDFSDPKTGVLFGDGAGAAVVTAGDAQGLGPFLLRSDGSQPQLLMADRDGGKVVMSGRDVYRRAVAEMTESIRAVTRRSGVSLDDVSLVVAHQANARILDAVAERLALPRAKLFTNVHEYGNTSAASIPIALVDAQEQGRLRDGDLVVLAAFGSGFVWGAALARWPARRPMTRPATAGAVSV